LDGREPHPEEIDGERQTKESGSGERAMVRSVLMSASLPRATAGPDRERTLAADGPALCPCHRRQLLTPILASRIESESLRLMSQTTPGGSRRRTLLLISEAERTRISTPC